MSLQDSGSGAMRQVSLQERMSCSSRKQQPRLTLRACGCSRLDLISWHGQSTGRPPELALFLSLLWAGHSRGHSIQDQHCRLTS